MKEKNQTGLPSLLIEDAADKRMIVKLNGIRISGVRQYVLKRTSCDPIVELELSLYCNLE